MAKRGGFQWHDIHTEFQENQLITIYIVSIEINSQEWQTGTQLANGVVRNSKNKVI
jgi:hypothetical protein